MLKKMIILLTLSLILSINVCVAEEMEKASLDVSIIGGTAIPYAKEDHLAYGIVKIWNKEDVSVVTSLSVTPNRNHPLDDNRYWGNYKENENIKIDANELRIHVFCFIVPKGSNAGKQTWTLNISTEGEIITKEMIINLPVTKNIEIIAPSWQPDILKLDFPPRKSDVIAIEASKSKTTLMMLKVAGNLDSKKVYDVELETTLPDIFFSCPEEISVSMSKPKNWHFDDQTFLPFTVIPVPLLTIDVPYSKHANMYKLELQLEEENIDLKTSLPFHLVVKVPPVEETVKAEVTEKNSTTVSVNETVRDNETIMTATKTVTVVNLSKTVISANPASEKVELEKNERETSWQSFVNWLMKLVR